MTFTWPYSGATFTACIFQVMVYSKGEKKIIYDKMVICSGFGDEIYLFSSANQKYDIHKKLKKSTTALWKMTKTLPNMVVHCHTLLLTTHHYPLPSFVVDKICNRK